MLKDQTKLCKHATWLDHIDAGHTWEGAGHPNKTLPDEPYCSDHCARCDDPNDEYECLGCYVGSK